MVTNIIASLLITYAEAAELLHISLRTVYQYVYAGTLVPYKRRGMRPMFRRDYIESMALGLPFDKNAAREVPVHCAAGMSKNVSPFFDNHMISQRGAVVKSEDC